MFAESVQGMLLCNIFLYCILEKLFTYVLVQHGNLNWLISRFLKASDTGLKGHLKYVRLVLAQKIALWLLGSNLMDYFRTNIAEGTV